MQLFKCKCICQRPEVRKSLVNCLVYLLSSYSFGNKLINLSNSPINVGSSTNIFVSPVTAESEVNCALIIFTQFKSLFVSLFNDETTVKIAGL